MNLIQQFYDKVFGNNDGKFTLADLPNKAVLIVGGTADFVMLFAEWRVYKVGLSLTQIPMLALGFVAVSSLPFYLGQLAFLYNRANKKQQYIAVSMVTMGLLVSAYYGFADYIIATNSVLTISDTVSLPLTASTLYAVAVVCTALLIISSLVYVLIDDVIANKIKSDRIKGAFEKTREEITIKRKLLADAALLRQDEAALKAQYPDDYDELEKQFANAANVRPTKGNRN